MLPVSNEYLQSMKGDLRDRGYMKVVLGDIPQFALFNHTFKFPSCSSGSTSSNGYFAYFTNGDVFFKKVYEHEDYATLENSWTKADGSMRFVPRENHEDFFYETGITSANLTGVGGEILRFGIEIEGADSSDFFTGLSIDFGENYPVNFDISVYSRGSTTTTQVRNNTSSVYILSNQIIGCTDSYQTVMIDFTFYLMSVSNTRLRIRSITLGEGMVFDNADIIDSSLETSISDIVTEIPQTDFSVTLDNQLLRYDLDDPDSDFAYLDNGTNVDVYYGYELSNGIEWLKVDQTLLISEVAADKQKLTISSCDILRTFTKKYYLGRVGYNAPYTFLQTIYDVLSNTIGTYNAEMNFDSALQNRLSANQVNPMPVVSAKQALQLISSLVEGVFKINLENYVSNNQVLKKIVVVGKTPDNTVSGDFTIENKDMLSDPEMIKRERIAEIELSSYEYRLDNSTSESVGTVSFVNTGDTAVVSLGDKVRSDADVVVSSGDVRIEGYAGAEYVKLKAYADDSTCTLYGVGEYKVRERVYTRVINTNGETLNWENPLVNDIAQVGYLLTRLQNYYSEETEYEYDTRGYPELEAGDVIYQENPYRENMKVRVIENTLNFNGAFSGHMRVRRVEL